MTGLALGTIFATALYAMFSVGILRAAPQLDPAELRRLTWAERRLAMFVAFVALAKTPSLLVRLRATNKELLKHVVSFL